MRMEDMILVSIDDHMVEPPDMYDNHVPEAFKDKVPHVIRNDQGVDEWEFQGQKTSTPFGMAATVGWPKEEWGFNPGSYSELRPGCFDVHERVRDMNANGVLASMNFPTMAFDHKNPDKYRLPLDTPLIPYSFGDARGW